MPTCQLCKILPAVMVVYGAASNGDNAALCVFCRLDYHREKFHTVLSRGESEIINHELAQQSASYQWAHEQERVHI